mmetsp:Transcript_11055/g.20658  ORF Transcript_11055/g.20658 Transcript_11055/m.20658 type:complete len:458 (+) Transcript_11055:78-1451(+)
MRSVRLRPIVHVACLHLLVVAAVDKGECKDGVCKDGSVETSALVQSRLSLKNKDSLEQKDNAQSTQASGQVEGPADTKNWIIQFAGTCTDQGVADFCKSAKCQKPKYLPSTHGVAITGLKASKAELDAFKAKSKGKKCSIVLAEPDPFAKAAALQEGQGYEEADGRGSWIVKFVSTCTDDGMVEFCKINKCAKPQIWPSKHGIAMTGLKASAAELEALKAKGGICKIETSQHDPFAKAAAFQQTEASADAEEGAQQQDLGEEEGSQKNWIVQLAKTCTDDGMVAFCETAWCKNPKVWPSESGYAITGLKASNSELKALKAQGGDCKIVMAEPNPFAKAGLLQKMQESEQAGSEGKAWIMELLDAALAREKEAAGGIKQKAEQKGWIIKFVSTCTDKGLEAFCKKAECGKPQILPSQHGIAITGLKASSTELAGFKAEGGECKIETAEPDPFAKAALL